MLLTKVYKILSAADWNVAETEGVSRTALDEDDGYVHLSTGAQLGETLTLHYKGAQGVRLLEYIAGELGDVRWEASRGGALFPHLYGDLRIDAAKRDWTLSLGSESVPVIPKDL